jgi:hypothetical protein
MGGLLTSSGDSRVFEQRRRRGDASRRRRRGFGCTGMTPVSADWANQRGLGANWRIPTLLAKKRNSTRQRARQRLNGGRRTCDGASWARSQSEREGEGARLCVQLSGEGRVSVGGLHKRLGHVGRGRKMHGRGRIHGGGHGRFGGTVLTDGTHRSARPSERTGGWADE